MSEFENTVQNISYTNKDFQRVYEELLDLTKQLTDKWDPSMSNESDPGVILLKLNAVIADKLNYNIDKSVLECFPASVTQLSNARNLLNQLGYRMKWKRSATTDIYINWIGEKTYNEYITIEPFTMVSDDEGSVVYSLLGMTDSSGIYSVGNMNLKCDGAASSSILCKAIQGIPVEYTLSGSRLITVENLDSNNRIYFSDNSVAENGIFIRNASSESNYNRWKMVDNLAPENYGNYYYEFGITDDGINCYLQFPDDVEQLFGEGIYITYIKTDAEYGNINANFISKFYNETTKELGGENVVLNSDVLSIYNISSALNGVNYEEINNAYKNYKRTVGTFNTLITLRDYINAILSSGLISNGFACDRNNDIQTTYKVISSINDIHQKINIIEKDSVTDEPLLTSFSLKLYLTNKTDDVSTMLGYSSGFSPVLNDSQIIQSVKAYIEEQKSITHDYEDLLPPTADSPHVLYFVNSYPVECNIIAQTIINNQQKAEIKNNIIQAIRKKFNSYNVEFGESISYDDLYNAIVSADERIKNVSLFNLDYTTNAVYLKHGEQITYSASTGKWYDNEYNVVIPSNYGLHPVSPVDGATLTLPDSYDYEPINGNNYKDYKICSNHSSLSESTITVNFGTFYSKAGSTSYEWHTFVYNSGWKEKGTSNTATSYGISVAPSGSHTGEFKVKLSYANMVKYDTIAKSVLAGNTQFYVDDETFDYRWNQQNTQIISDIVSVRGNVNVDVTNSNNTYLLRDKESIQLYSPNLMDSASYSNSVKFEYFVSKDINANANYQLKENEYVIFYWVESDDELGAVYKYHAYGNGTVICPTTALQAVSSSTASQNIAERYGLIKYDLENHTIESSWAKDSAMSIASSQEIANITDTKKILTGSKKITIKTINKFTIDSSSGYYLYWVINQPSSADGISEYTLFNSGDTTKMLSSGEYIIYTNSYKSSFEILGEGTTVTRSNSSGVWSVQYVDPTDVVENGIDALEGKWFSINDSTVLTVVENAFTNIGSGCSIKFSVRDPVTDYYTITTANSFSGTISLDRNTWLSKGFSAGTYEFTYSGSVWSLEGASVDLSEYGITISSGTPTTNSTITVTVIFSYKISFNKDGEKIYVPSTSTVPSTSHSLGDFEISYKLPGTDDADENWIVLDDVVLNETTKLSGRSILSLSFNSKNQQYILDNQSVICTNSEGTITTITGSAKDTSTNSYPCAIMGDMSVDTFGSENANTEYSYYDDNGELVSDNLKIFKYKEILDVQGTPSSGSITYGSDGNLTVLFKPSESSKSITFSLPVGDYIIALHNNNTNLTSLTVSIGGVTQHEIYDNTKTNFKDYGIHYIDYNASSGANLTMTITMSGHGVESAVMFDNIYKYVHPSRYTDSEKTIIKNRMLSLDYNHNYMYNYIVDDSNRINDPILASSFNNKNHIYNPFTICQFTHAAIN